MNHQNFINHLYGTFESVEISFDEQNLNFDKFILPKSPKPYFLIIEYVHLLPSSTLSCFLFFLGFFSLDCNSLSNFKSIILSNVSDYFGQNLKFNIQYYFTPVSKTAKQIRLKSKNLAKKSILQIYYEIKQNLTKKNQYYQQL